MPTGSLQPKKMLIVNILEILKRYSDENHRLSVKRIGEILENEYGMKVERKAISRNLLNLTEMFNIEYSEKKRIVPERKNGKLTGEMTENYSLSDYYLVRDFDESELRLLIDGLLFSKHIPYSQCKELVEKIESLSSKYFESKMKHVRNLPELQPENKQLFYNITILDEALTTEKQVSFCYNNYDIDKKLHPRTDENGEKKTYIVNPYQMVATNGRYYLICNIDGHDNIANMRLDRITDIKLLENLSKPKANVTELTGGRLDLPKHMAEHIYMFHGESGNVTFRAKRYIVNDIFDWFGSDVKFSDITDSEVTVSVKANIMAMRCWAMQYAEHIEVLSPESLRQDIKNALLAAYGKYGK